PAVFLDLEVGFNRSRRCCGVCVLGDGGSRHKTFGAGFRSTQFNHPGKNAAPAVYLTASSTISNRRRAPNEHQLGGRSRPTVSAAFVRASFTICSARWSCVPESTSYAS